MFPEQGLSGASELVFRMISMVFPISWTAFVLIGNTIESTLEKTKAGQLLAQAEGKHIGRPAGLNTEKFAKFKKALERGLSVAEIVSLAGISVSNVRRYRRQIKKTIDIPTISK